MVVISYQVSKRCLTMRQLKQFLESGAKWSD